VIGILHVSHSATGIIPGCNYMLLKPHAGFRISNFASIIGFTPNGTPRPHKFQITITIATIISWHSNPPAHALITPFKFATHTLQIRHTAFCADQEHIAS
jgi:hypothetical protein